MAEKEPEEEGHKGGMLEGALHRYYEPTVTAVTDMVVPATRIQWGPTFAGVITALAFTLLFASLGVAVGVGLPGLGYWVIGFGSVGLFIGNLLTARMAKAGLAPALAHSVIVWGIVLILTTLAVGSLGGALAARAPILMTAGAVAAGFGWRFFIGFIIMLGASVLGGLFGMVHEEREHGREHGHEHTQ